MIIKWLFFCLLMNVLALSQAAIFSSKSQLNLIKQEKDRFFNLDKIGTPISSAMLPAPYNYLLTQPLMTLGIKKYYHRTPIIQAIYSQKNNQNNSYYRAIKMIIDSNTARNNANLAFKKNEAVVVELAFIVMNFNELPEKVKNGILKTNTPFGQLLIDNHVQVISQDRSYFSVDCNRDFKMLIHCKLNEILYGRTNTLIRADNKKWIAHVIEILPAPSTVEVK